jgi:beta-phosphoglucomutase-like phosphatase (HAD superfamily)
VPLIEGQIGGRCPDQIRADWSRLCHERAATDLTPVAGFLDFLAGRSEPRCVASSSPVDWIEMGLERFGVADTFGGPIFSAAVHVTRGKPHPDLFLHAAEVMNVAPERALVIEDTPTGVRAGVAAGMTVVGLLAGGHVRDGHGDLLAAAGAHAVFADYPAVAAFMANPASEMMGFRP